MGTYKLSPSLMCADLLGLKEVLDLFAEQGVEYLHIDVMDGHYVPNFGLGMDLCRSIYTYSAIPLDIHLMVDNPDDHIASFASLRGSVYGFHPDICPDPLKTLRRVREEGLRPGLVMKPDIPLDMLKDLMPEADLVNIMTVHPGYAGQPLVPGAMERIREAAVWIASQNLEVELEVDGNVSWENIPAMVRAGATVFVAGTSSLFSRDGNLKRNLHRFRRLLGSKLEL
jgi:ribulose-phosphate 3-epimerase